MFAWPLKLFQVWNPVWWLLLYCNGQGVRDSLGRISRAMGYGSFNSISELIILSIIFKAHSWYYPKGRWKGITFLDPRLPKKFQTAQYMASCVRETKREWRWGGGGKKGRWKGGREGRKEERRKKVKEGGREWVGGTNLFIVICWHKHPLLQGYAVIERGVMALNWKRRDLA